MPNQQEIAILRDLAKRTAELAAEEKNQESIRSWTRLNDLDRDIQPQVLVHLWALAWEEVLPDSELECTSPMARRYERELRRAIWTAETLDSENVVEPVIAHPLAFSLRDYSGLDGGLHAHRRYAEGHGDGAAELVPVIVDKGYIEKLGDPVLEVDHDAMARNRQWALEVFSPYLTVVKQPYTFAAKVSDEFSWLRGLENTYTDIIEDPQWVHEALQRITANFRKRFELVEDAGVWGVAHKSDPLGSAGLRFASDLPDWRTADDSTTFAPKLAESWGFTCAEVFTCVSPRMHDEFGFEYDRQLMGLFRHINVGCCETLDTKAHLLKSLPNVRKVAVSEWCDVVEAAENIGPDFVYSYRAAGVHFVQEPWDRDAAREEISDVLDAADGCPLEIVLNIGGTLGKGDPVKKLVEWCQMVRELL